MKDMILYDNVYENPDEIRDNALKLFKTTINEDTLYYNWHFPNYKGNYSDIPGLINENETIMGRNFEIAYSLYNEFHIKLIESLLKCKIQYTNEKNGIFILNNCLSNPVAVNVNNIKQHHNNIEEWVGIIFLTPNAPVEGGLTITNYKKLNIHSIDSLKKIEEPFRTTIINEIEKHKRDDTQWETDTQFANVYNRLILLKKNIFYKSSLNFGITLNDSRMTQFFSFGVRYL
jgi:hypothetical protein